MENEEVDKIAEKEWHDGHEPQGIDDQYVEEMVPQHVIDEAVADASRERTKELKQMEMYDSQDWNWSGFR